MASCDQLLWQVIDEKINIQQLLTDLHKFNYDTSNIKINEQEKANCAIDKKTADALKYTFNNQSFNKDQANKFDVISKISGNCPDSEIFYRLLEQNVLSKFKGQYFIVFLTELLKIDINLFRPQIKSGINEGSLINHNDDDLPSSIGNSKKKVKEISVTRDDPQIKDFANNVFYSTFPSPAPTPTAQICSGSPVNFGSNIPRFPFIDESFGGACNSPLVEEKNGPPGLSKSTGIFTGATYIIPDEMAHKEYSPPSPPRMKTSISSCNNTPERTKKQSAFDRYKEGFYSESKLNAILREKYNALEEKSNKELELVKERYEAEKKVLQDQIDTFKSQFDQISRVNDFLMKSLDAQTQTAKDN